VPNNTIARIRRNHGLEHATIHVLSEHHKGFSAQGNSDHRGFHLNIYGGVSPAEVNAAVEEAHRRLKAGEHRLAVHPNCGTVLVTTAALATLAAQSVLALENWREPRESRLRPATLLNSLPGATIAVAGALIVGRPLGIHLQERYTVDGDLRDLRVVAVREVPPSIVARFFHLLLTGRNRQLPPSSYFVQTAGGDS
jgi:ethanolamine utilization microcompartment shell protein EutL